MMYTVATKPFYEGICLVVVNSNISKFNRKSSVIQVSVKDNLLLLNTEADNVKSEVRLKGGYEGSESVSILVDCVMLKQLVSTFDSQVIQIEFVENGMILYSGSSKFTVPMIADVDNLELSRPDVNSERKYTVDLKKENWKFVDDHQMFALSMSFTNAVFTRVWAGQSGDVIVGDMDNSIFTHSTKSTLDETCLLQESIINMFVSVPDGTKISKLDRSYLLVSQTDSYELYSEITPDRESNPKYGSYNSDIILDMLHKTEVSAVVVDSASILKALNQSELLRNESADTHVVDVVVCNKKLHIKDSNVNCSMDVEGDMNANFTVHMKEKTLKPAISNLDQSKITIAPAYNSDSDDIVGLVMWTDNMEVIVGGAEV